MSTTKRESLHQVQKSYQHAILLHSQGSHPKEIKILTHSLHGQIGIGGHVVCLSYSRRHSLHQIELRYPMYLSFVYGFYRANLSKIFEVPHSSKRRHYQS